MMEQAFTPYPEFSTARLYLRRLRAEDANDLLILRKDESVSRYIARKRATTLPEAESFIKMINNGIDKKEWFYWALTLKNYDTLIGTCCLWNISWDNRRAEIGYELSPQYQGKGLMQEAIEALIQFAFGSMQLHSIEANVNPGNIASVKRLEKNGFIKEAHFKENVWFNNEFRDTAIYSLLEPDFH